MILLSLKLIALILVALVVVWILYAQTVLFFYRRGYNWAYYLERKTIEPVLDILF